jgi:Na+/H+ antiporter NhaD/arsenite permease-like protein
VPYLLAVAMASNIGSTATITGNPQNMMIGSFSQIPYGQFTASLAPVALVGLVLTFVLIALFHRGEFAGGARLVAATAPARIHRVLMLRALIATERWRGDPAVDRFRCPNRKYPRRRLG